jgi:phytanoyl-CoA hydroxylase
VMADLLNEERKAFYSENGYVVVPNVLTQDELADVREAVDKAYSGTLDTSHDNIGKDEAFDAIFHQKVNLWQLSEGIRRHTFNSRLARIARALLEVPDVRLWHDQCLVKPPGKGQATPVHQDLPYWPMLDPEAITAWTALDDTTLENGCMAYVPGSHHWGTRVCGDFHDPRPVEEVAPAGASPEPVPVPIAAGSVIYHHSLTFHGARPNISTKPRRAMIVHYMKDGMPFRDAKHIVTEHLDLREGDAMVDDALWPVLSDGPGD